MKRKALIKAAKEAAHIRVWVYINKEHGGWIDVTKEAVYKMVKRLGLDDDTEFDVTVDREFLFIG